MNGREKNGQFANGNGGGPGRPKKKREKRYYEITQTACTFKDWRAIVKRAVDDAKKGDTAARKWLSDYLLGPPVQRQEISGADGEPLFERLVIVPRDEDKGN